MAQEQIKQFIDQATQSIQSGQFDGALTLIDQALALSPDDADAHILRGICLSQTGQPVAATDAFRRAIYLDPNSAKAQYNLAVHQYALGQKLEALSAAREASNLDASHAGARQLISNLESELGGPSPKSTPNPNDPLAAPPVIPGGADTGTAISQPNPYAPGSTQPGMPMPPPAGPAIAPIQRPPAENPYQRAQYESPAHSLPFVENLGKAWLTIGWSFAGLSLLGFIFGVIVGIQAFQSMDINSKEPITVVMERFTGLLWVSRIAGLTSLVGIMVWSIMDLIDRRGNFVWLIPNIICSCCGFGWITLPIYILAGRND